VLLRRSMAFWLITYRCQLRLFEASACPAPHRILVRRS
jgi:hypothetical protein